MTNLRAKLATTALAAVLIFGGTTACVTGNGGVANRFTGAPQAFQILSATPEAETKTRGEQRKDLFANTVTGEPIPYVVTKGAIGPFNRKGGRVRLYGDNVGQQGWNVDNFVLFEVTDRNGMRIHRFAVGFQQGVSSGSEQIDSVGAMQFQFAPGEIDITRFLPEDEDITITATALDTGGTGVVSDLWLILSEDRGRTGAGSYDFRD